ncbi:hypothetical protein GIB67_008057 [Kingdonia uniflora]|uniref:Stress-response A/B barrel domain-containing protein n=1 Tax=Kingdonia uniflora TaxID=39325 RepID=A0A7J7MN92_9MAGN|nr:hypothetical protein GIB67_008057 [Kingdonia uniflora]
MAADWVLEDLEGAMGVKPGAAIRISLVKLKEGLGESEKGEVLGMIGGIKGKFSLIDQISFGENFSPARAKGFSIAVFPGLSELDALDENVEAVEEQKEKVKGLLESEIVVDYEAEAMKMKLQRKNRRRFTLRDIQGVAFRYSWVSTEDLEDFTKEKPVKISTDIRNLRELVSEGTTMGLPFQNSFLKNEMVDSLYFLVCNELANNEASE